MNTVIPLHGKTNSSYEIVVLEANLSNSMMQAVQALRENKIVILKLETLDKQRAQRLVDFLCGSAYAISAHPSKVGKAVFLSTPYNIQIQTRGVG